MWKRARGMRSEARSIRQVPGVSRVSGSLWGRQRDMDGSKRSTRNDIGWEHQAEYEFSLQAFREPVDCPDRSGKGGLLDEITVVDDRFPSGRSFFIIGSQEGANLFPGSPSAPGVPPFFNLPSHEGSSPIDPGRRTSSDTAAGSWRRKECVIDPSTERNRSGAVDCGRGVQPGGGPDNRPPFGAVATPSPS